VILMGIGWPPRPRTHLASVPVGLWPSVCGSLLVMAAALSQHPVVSI
jgi:hypothetical protein